MLFDSTPVSVALTANRISQSKRGCVFVDSVSLMFDSLCVSLVTSDLIASPDTRASLLGESEPSFYDIDFTGSNLNLASLIDSILFLYISDSYLADQAHTRSA